MSILLVIDEMVQCDLTRDNYNNFDLVHFTGPIYNIDHFNERRINMNINKMGQLYIFNKLTNHINKTATDLILGNEEC